jgi:hypothetical protein
MIFLLLGLSSGDVNDCSRGALAVRRTRELFKVARLKGAIMDFVKGGIIEMSVNGPLGGSSEGEMNLVEEETKNDG